MVAEAVTAFILLLGRLDSNDQMVLEPYPQGFKTVEECMTAGYSITHNPLLPWRIWVCAESNKGQPV